MLRSLLVVSLVALSGCAGVGGLAPSGVMDYGCEPNCTSKDYYIPGKGVWASEKTMKKADYGAIGGSAIAAALASSTDDPLIIASAAVIGLLVGYEVGATLDKIDAMYAEMVIHKSLSDNRDRQKSTWYHPTKNMVVNTMPINTDGQCREFITSVQVDSQLKEMRGTACLNNGEWELKEIY